MKSKSFTLIELLVVIVIIGILAGVIMISTSSSIDKANLAKAQAFSKTVQNELLLNLISEWTFDNSSNYGEDSWGNNNGTIYGTLQPLDGSNCVFGKCLNFSGNYIDCGDGLMNTTSYTKSVWIKTTSQNASNIISGNSAEHVLYCSGGNIVVSNTWTTPQMSRAANFYDNRWHYVVFAYSNGYGTLYFDGTFLSPQNSLSNVPSNSRTYIGSFSAGNLFSGSMDEIRIYNTALSSSQIKQNYIAGLDSLLSKGSISKKDYKQRISELAYNEYE